MKIVKTRNNWRCWKLLSLFKWNYVSESQGDKQGMPFFGMGQNNWNVWFYLSLHFWSNSTYGRRTLHHLLCFFSCLFFLLGFFYTLSSYFPAVEHCIWFFFFTDHIYFTIFVEDCELVWLYFCIFKASSLLFPRCAYCCPWVWLWRKKKNFKNPHFLLRRKHLAFIYLCMENTWYFIPVASGCTRPLLKDATKLEYNTFWKAD